MEIEKVLAEYDGMFGTAKLSEIEAFLVKKIQEAREEGDLAALFTLWNESIGFYRDTTQKEKSLRDAELLKDLIGNMHLEGRVEYATALLNIANAYRAFGLHEESLKLHQQVEENYKKHLAPGDFAYASLYNNWSLLYQEMGDFEGAKEKLMQALSVVDLYPEAVIPQATTRTNLAATLIQLGSKEDYENAVSYLKEALLVYEKDGGRDFHYGAALVAMGDAQFYQNSYETAAKYYKRGMEELEKHVGMTDNYQRVKEKYQCALKKKEEQEIKKTTTQKSKQEIEQKTKEKTKEETKQETKEETKQETKEETKQEIKEETKEKIKKETTNQQANNLTRCRKFYEAYGASMIHEKFPEYEERIAVGLVGEGSDCFGYDDEISKDHDYGLGFCMWLCEEDFIKIGKKLQKEYEMLMEQQEEVSQNLFFSDRRGVFSINQFYNRILETDCDFEKGEGNDFLHYEEANLAAAVNGEVFRDDLGLFLRVRNRLAAYYPEQVWRLRIAKELHDFSQYAQSNYPRMMARKDDVTAGICVANAMEQAMNLVFLLNRRYAPYYKWKKRALDELANLKEVGKILEQLAFLKNQKEAWEPVTYSSRELNKKDQYVVYFEEIAALILEELRQQGLVEGKDTFLEQYCKDVIQKKEKKDGENMDYITEIINLEWKQFDQVKNEGGRADCQDDFNTFSIMRKSQYMTWTQELLESYYGDLLGAEEKGWNLITEKYARMMKSTAPEKYKELEPQLPVLNEERIAIQEEIIKIQVGWMEEFAKQYPNMAGNARKIHTEEDSLFETSYETYLRGEMGTYSETTFLLYGRFVTGLLKEKKNLAYEIMNQTAKLYGYDSVEDAERQLGKNLS